MTLCGRNAVQVNERERPLDLAELKERLAPLGEVRANEFALRFRVEPYEMTIFPDGARDRQRHQRRRRGAEPVCALRGELRVYGGRYCSSAWSMPCCSPG